MKQPVSPIGHNVFHVHDTTCFLYMSLLVSCTCHDLFHVQKTTCNPAHRRLCPRRWASAMTDTRPANTKKRPVSPHELTGRHGVTGRPSPYRSNTSYGE